MEPHISMPIIPVNFIYISEGEIGKQFLATCSSVPREGELVFPEAGSSKVIVHAVVYRTQTLDKGRATLLPTVFLRELTQDEEERIGTIIK
jgi:hypothetical protein